MKKIFFGFMLCWGSANAQSLDYSLLSDSAKLPTKWYESTALKSAVVPAMLIGYGIATIGKNELIISSSDVQQWRQKEFPQFTTEADDYMPSAPLVIMFGLDAAGIKSKNSWVNQAIIFGLANALNGWSTRQIKHNTSIRRPDGRDRLSFPSAHTSSAFVAAEMLHQEFKNESPWISVAGYTLASTVGALRI